MRLSIVGHSEIAPAATTQTPASMGDTQPSEAQPQNFQDTTFPESPNQTQRTQQQQSPMTPLQCSSASVPYTYSELDWSSTLWTPVVIRADPCAALSAAQLLRDKVGQMDDVVMDIPLGRARHAAVVGRRGYVLANMSARTNVRIMVPRRELRHDVIQLEGDLENVKQCLDRVLTIAADPPGSSSSRKRGKDCIGGTESNKTVKDGRNSSNNNKTCVSAFGPRQPPEKNEDAASVVLNLSSVPSQHKMRMIGKRTETLIKKKKADDSTWKLTVTGSSAERIQSAVAILKRWNEDNASNLNDSNEGSAAINPSNPHNAPSKSRGRGRQRNNRNRSNKPGKASGIACAGNANSGPSS